jgi:hypothetical protein
LFFCCILGPWAMAIHCRAVKIAFAAHSPTALQQ